MPQLENDPEHVGVDRGQPPHARSESHTVREPTAFPLSLDETLVFPDSLAEESRSLEEAATRLDRDERNVVVLDGQNPAKKKPAPEHPLAGVPGLKEVGDVGWKRHAKEGSELAVDTRGACGVAPHRLRDRKKMR